jgi:ribonucleoside-diphosphate reductase alpha chain
MSKTIYEELSEERKLLQESVDLPEWFTTASWQVFKNGYLHNAKGYKDTCHRIAATLSTHTHDHEHWKQKFFDILWKGWLAPSTPVLANTGTNKGMPVSCSGTYVGDSIHDFYDAYKEIAILSKLGFGTSTYLGDIRALGSPISTGKHKASGILPVIKNVVNVMRDVTQGGTRRGSCASYFEVEHKDFDDVMDYLKEQGDDLNIGINIDKNFIDKLQTGDIESNRKWRKILKSRMVSGKPYIGFIDKVNELKPQVYKNHDLKIRASNLCCEVMLPSSQDETFICVLSSLNLKYYNDFKDTDATQIAIYFLWCVNQEFIKLGKNIPGIERAVRFAENHQALGLGTLGFHTILQQNSIPFESLEAHMLNNQIFKNIRTKADEMNKWIAEQHGECKYTKGTKTACTTLIAVAPNLTSAILAGGVSQSIEPVYENAYTQGTAQGELNRINPVLLQLLKDKCIYTNELIEDIIEHNGSVQHLEQLTEHEKLVFKTAFEIDQKVILRLASQRQKYIDQGQSLNLFFSANEDEEYIAEVHQLAAIDPYIKFLYYVRSKAGVQASKNICVACEG